MGRYPYSRFRCRPCESPLNQSDRRIRRVLIATYISAIWIFGRPDIKLSCYPSRLQPDNPMSMVYLGKFGPTPYKEMTQKSTVDFPKSIARAARFASAKNAALRAFVIFLILLSTFMTESAISGSRLNAVCEYPANKSNLIVIAKAGGMPVAVCGA